MNLEKLTVVMPVYNEKHLVQESIRRVLSSDLDNVSELELVVIDDASTDGTSLLLERVAKAEPRIKLLRHGQNAGKGAAIRTGIEACSGDLILIQDADLEYNPRDYRALLLPFFSESADVVYGSRFLGGSQRRVLYFWHSIGNRLITLFSNALTDLNLTDVETCYKVFRRGLITSIPIRSNRFGFEPEITAKVAKRRARIFEVPISYSGRTYQEGKKINWKDGVSAFYTIIKFWLVDDIYRADESGSHILQSLDKARRFNQWMASELLPYVGEKVLEIGAGIGNMTAWVAPRQRYVATDINPIYLDYLENMSVERPYMETQRVDLCEPSDFDQLEGQMDTVVCLNVLEHVADPNLAVANMYRALQSGGRMILYVPAGQWLFGTLDEVLEHRCRYSQESLVSEVERAGFEVEKVWDFNKFSVPGWFINGKILRRQYFGRVQLKLIELLAPIIQRIDRFLPWKGLGIFLVARRPLEN